MYHVSVQGIDEHMINVHYYYKGVQYNTITSISVTANQL